MSMKKLVLILLCLFSLTSDAQVIVEGSDTLVTITPSELRTLTKMTEDLRITKEEVRVLDLLTTELSSLCDYKDSVISNKDSIIAHKDIIIKNTNLIVDQKDQIINKKKKELKKKRFISGGIGFAVGLLISLIL